MAHGISVLLALAISSAMAVAAGTMGAAFVSYAFVKDGVKGGSLRDALEGEFRAGGGRPDGDGGGGGGGVGGR